MTANVLLVHVWGAKVGMGEGSSVTGPAFGCTVALGDEVVTRVPEVAVESRMAALTESQIDEVG